MKEAVVYLHHTKPIINKGGAGKRIPLSLRKIKKTVANKQRLKTCNKKIIAFFFIFSFKSYQYKNIITTQKNIMVREV